MGSEAAARAGQGPTDLPRRSLLLALGLLPFWRPSRAEPSEEPHTFLFCSDVHACRIASGLSPHCQQAGKTDENLLRHIRALNDLPNKPWPVAIGGKPTRLPSAGRRIGRIDGLVMGGDMTDDGGGQTAEHYEGSQILQFSHRYQQGTGPDTIHFPVYTGLGNHDLDQDGHPPDIDWYRNELRDYVRFNHQPSVFFKSAVPVQNFDPLSDSYSWNWGSLHLVQLHRFGGDSRKRAISALTWLRQDLAANPGRPVVLFQHYGWDRFSTERWDPAHHKFDTQGAGPPHWWSEEERHALLACLSGSNVLGIFHGHEHETPMIYNFAGFDVFKPIAAFMGGFALVRFSGQTFEVALGHAADDHGAVEFTDVFFRTM